MTSRLHRDMLLLHGWLLSASRLDAKRNAIKFKV